MMVIRAQHAAAFEGIPAATGSNYTIFPADRCTWMQSYNTTTNEYNIGSARFLGNGTTSLTLTSATLGYIW